MKETSFKKIIFIFSIICLILGIICIVMGFDKMLNYQNSDTYVSKNKNVYVVGDAYNYIINANYFSGYVSLGGCLIISSTILITTCVKMCEEDKKNKDSV